MISLVVEVLEKEQKLRSLLFQKEVSPLFNTVPVLFVFLSIYGFSSNCNKCVTVMESNFLA